MIYSIGEMLIDLMQEKEGYIAHPGGAPANVAIHAKRSGAPAVFVGKISSDHFGTQLLATLKQHQVYFELPLSDLPTTLAVVSHHQGERSFQFYRNNTADLFLSKTDIDLIPFQATDILHLCSLGLVAQGTTYQAHRHAIACCQKAQGIVSFDINLRARLWSDLALAKHRCLNVINQVNIVKVNEEELFWLTNTDNIEQGMRQLQTNNQLIICTLAEHGAKALTSKKEVITYQHPAVTPVDTTGAGDSYIAIILASLANSQLDFMTWQAQYLLSAMKQAAFVSAQVVAKIGAVPEVRYIDK